jgi:outer membrane protein assembly factor BamB
VYALERATGKVRWKQLSAPGVSSTLLADGQSIWKMQVTEPGRDRYLPSPVLRNRVVYVGGYLGTVTAVNAQTGDRVWQRNVEPNTGVQPVVAADGVYAVTDSSIYKVDVSTGQLTSNSRFKTTPTFQPVAMADLIQFQDHTMQAFSGSKEIKSRWSRKANFDLTTHGPFLVNEDVIVADESGQLLAFRLSDGVPQWKLKFPEVKGPITIIASDKQHIYVGTQGGTLFAFDSPR